MAGFEYKTMCIESKKIEHSDKALTHKLNYYGKEGWELVTSFTYPYIGSSQYSFIGITQKITLILKKEVSSEMSVNE